MDGSNINILETILKSASELSMRLLLDDLQLRYEGEYNKFEHLCEEQTLHMNQVSDATMIVYMSELAKKIKLNTSRSRFSTKYRYFILRQLQFLKN